MAYPPADEPSPPWLMPFWTSGGIVAGPNGTLAAPLELCTPIDASTCQSIGVALSKFAAGAWTTRMLTTDVTAHPRLAINASGQAVALVSTSSEERFRLRIHRF